MGCFHLFATMINAAMDMVTNACLVLKVFECTDMYIEN